MKPLNSLPKVISCFFAIFLISISLYGQGANDRVLVGNIDRDFNDEVIFFNRSYSGASIRAIDLVSGASDTWIGYDSRFASFIQEEDFVGIGDVNGNGQDELILVDYTDNNGVAVLVVDLIDGSTIKQISNTYFNGWKDDGDSCFVADVNKDGRADLVLINMSGTDGFLRVMDLTTGMPLKTIYYSQVSPSLNGWLDVRDKMYMGNVGGSSSMDLVLVNTDYSSGAIRAIDIMTGTSVSWVSHGAFGGLMDESDRILFGDVDGDGFDDLVFINTNYTGLAIKSISINDNRTISELYHGDFNGWIDACDRVFLNDVNGDNKKDLVFVNTSYNSGAIRAIDLIEGSNLSWILHSDFNGWMDEGDKMFMTKVSYLNPYKESLCFINTTISSGAIRVIDLISNSNVLWLSHSDVFPSLHGWLDGSDSHSNLCIDGSSPNSWVDPFVKLDENGKFRLFGSSFYPKVLNYTVNVTTDSSGVFWLNPNRSYYPNKPDGVPSNKEDGLFAINEDLSIIASMGFNTVRVCMGTLASGDSVISDTNVYMHYRMLSDGAHAKISHDDLDFRIPFGFVDEILDLAKQNGMRVILLAGGGFCSGPLESENYAIYLAQLADHVKNNPTLLAFDLVNEPSRSDANKYLTQSKCQNASTVNMWCNTIRQSNPNHLITIGLFNHRDVIFKYDHSLMDVDFISIHDYAYDTNFEYNEELQRNFYWLHNNLDKPWIIGETGAEAFDFDPDCTTSNDSIWNHDGGTIGEIGHREEAQQRFAHSVFRSSTNCGSVGFSWWAYHDSQEGYYFGLVSNCMEKIKVAAQEFSIDGLDLECTDCNYPGDQVYFNQRPISERETYVYGKVLNEKGEAVKDAVIRLYCCIPYIDSVTNETKCDDYSYYTFADSNGFYTGILPIHDSVDSYLYQVSFPRMKNESNWKFISSDTIEIVLPMENMNCKAYKPSKIKTKDFIQVEAPINNHNRFIVDYINGNIVVKLSDPQDVDVVEIYNVNGAIVDRVTNVSGFNKISINSGGIYVVSLIYNNGNRQYKKIACY